MKSRKLTTIMAMLVLPTMSAIAASTSQIFTGEVSDSMCGTKHMMPGEAACTRACVGKGSNYALVVGDKVYTLHTADKAALDELDKLSGAKAKVTGSAEGDIIEVSKVESAK